MKNLERDFFLFAPGHPKRIVQRFLLPAIFHVIIPVDFLPVNYIENLKRTLEMMRNEQAEAESIKENYNLDNEEIFQMLNQPLQTEETILCWFGKMSFLFQTIFEEFDNEILIKTILKDYEEKFHVFRNIWKIFEENAESFNEHLKVAKTFNNNFRTSFLLNYPQKFFESPPNSVIIGPEDHPEQPVENSPFNYDQPAHPENFNIEDILN